jgi:3-oxoacyl-[acyl-carrier protein] reductase
MSERKVAVVTGSSSGMGQRAAIRFAERGYDVVVNYTRREEGAIQTAKEVEAAGGRALTVRADVSHEESVKGLVAQALDAFGRIDALVNAAGTTTDQKPRNLEDTTMDEWDRVMAVNLKGPFFAARAAAPALEKTKGSIVNMSSLAGVRPTAVQPYAYGASKGGLVTVTKLLAANLGPRGIRVNAVLPGWVLGTWMEDQLGENYQWLNDRRAKATPLGRVADNDDVAEVVVTVADQLHFMTGQIFCVDGGYCSIT